MLSKSLKKARSLINSLNLIRIGFDGQIRLGGILVFSTLGLVSLLLILVYLNTQKKAKSVNHSNSVLISLENLESTVRELESGMRGYIQSGYPEFLADYNSQRNSVSRSFYDIVIATADNPQQQQLLKTLKPMLDSRLLLLDQNRLLSEKKQKNNELIASLQVEGRQLMRKITASINLIKIEERNLLTERLNSYYRNSSTSLLIIILIVFLAALILGLVFILLQNEFKARKEHENRLYLQQLNLEEKILKLNSSNQALEQFAYVASHDLQEPLRKILSFSDLLIVKKEQFLDEETMQYIDRIVHSAGRMRNLIQDLLAYSKAIKQVEDFEKINPNELIESVKDDLESFIAEKKAAIVVSPLISISADPVQMQQLIQNLLSNAIKFSRENIPPVIEISGKLIPPGALETPPGEAVSPEMYQITFKDNGIGFDEKYLDRIFVIFQRLHGGDVYGGTGIGLAVCKRIAENHGGFISASSKVGEGTSFFVYLPV